MKDQFEGNCQSISYQFITKLVREDWLSLQGVAEPSSEHAEQTSPRTHPVSVEITRQYQFIHHFPSLTKTLIKASFQDNILYSIQETKKTLSNDWTLLRSLLFVLNQCVHCPLLQAVTAFDDCHFLFPWHFKGFFLQWMKQPIPNCFYTFYIHVQVESLEEKAILVNSWMFI